MTPTDSYLAGEGTLRAEIPIVWVFQLSVSLPFLDFSEKCLLESPGNVEICFIKFVDVLPQTLTVPPHLYVLYKFMI